MSWRLPESFGPWVFFPGWGMDGRLGREDWRSIVTDVLLAITIMIAQFIYIVYCLHLEWY